MTEDDKKPSEYTISARQILKRKEAKLLVCGLVLVILYCQFLIVMFFLNPNYAGGLASMTIAHFFGRAAGLTHGYYVLKYSSWVVVSVNALLETIVVFIVYPVFVLSMEDLVVWRALSDKVLSIRDSAEKKKSWVRRFGLIGLFLFVLFPFWMTGPIVGCIIGYLMHMRMWVNLSVVLGGTYAAIFAWASIFKSLQAKIEAYGVWAPASVVGMVVLASAVMHLVHRHSKNTQKSASSDASDDSV